MRQTLLKATPILPISLQSATVLLKSTSIVLQNVTVIRKCNVCYKILHYNVHFKIY